MKISFFFGFWFLLLLTLALGACTIVNGYDPDSGLVFQDDFNDASSGWSAFDQPAGRAAYMDGRYQVTVVTPRTHLAASLPADFRIPRDVYITVEAGSSSVASGGNDYFGIICRYQNPYNYYFLAVSQDGYYGIGKMKAGNASLLNGSQMLPTDAIVQSEKNILTAECAGTLLRFTINGTLVGEVEDQEWVEGGIGLLAASGDGGELHVEFDRLLVKVVR